MYKKLSGNGSYRKNRGSACQIETDGNELYLGRRSGKGFETVGNGLYLMNKGGLYDDRGLILGPNCPFKNIPFLGMILWDYFEKKIYTLKLDIDEIDGNDEHIYIVLKKLIKYRKY